MNAFDEGAHAYVDGKSLAANPYGTDQARLRLAWYDGFHAKQRVDGLINRCRECQWIDGKHSEDCTQYIFADDVKGGDARAQAMADRLFDRD